MPRGLFLIICFSTLNVFAAIPQNQKSILEKQPDKIYGDFIHLAFDESAGLRLRWKALMSAAQMRKQKATPDLIKASKNAQWFMRTAALAALAEYDPAQGDTVAKGLLKDKALVVRSAAVDFLTVDMTPQTRDLFWEELHQKYNFKNKKSLWIRPQLVKALALKPLDQETNLFASLLKESETKIQMHAVAALEKLSGMRLGQPQATPSEIVALWKKKYD